jgi:RNA polymerase sigma-70 factor, ECF subfamily
LNNKGGIGHEGALGWLKSIAGPKRQAMNVGGAGSLTLVHGRDSAAESRLVEALRRGDPATVGRVYDAHHTAVRAFARRLVGDDATAEDLVHEVFVSLPAAMRRFEGQSALRTFLISIAVNHARHHLRAAARRRRAMDRLALEPAGHPPDPEHAADCAALARALHRALDELPIDQRVAFVLCEVEERTSREVAEIAGVPEATVRTRLFHARRKLREALEKEGFR